MTTVASRPSHATPAPKKRSKIVDYLTTTDHKKIGVMYLYFSFFAFLVGGMLALGVRAQLATPGGTMIEDPDTYNALFTMHASAMLFFFIIPIWAGWGNYIVPLQIGALDMAYPRINALSFWLLPAGFVTMFSGYLMKGGPAQAGWTEYPPLTAARFMPGYGTDLWIVGLLLVGISSTLGAINFMVTIFKMRAPGMTMFRMPVFTWNILVTSILTLLALPVLTSALIMLFIDRNYGGSFFDPGVGGNAILWQNLFWFYSHPAVYIMILPAFGLISEVIPVFSRKPLFGYKAFVFATIAIGGLGFSVWAHHMFATGQVLLPFFALMTAFIAVPTGVKFFNWIATLWQGKITFESPMLFAIGFLTMFLIGGLNGMFTASPPVDYALHDTYWVVAHIHDVLFGGSVFAVFSSFYFWYPKVTGRMMDDKLGKVHFWITFVGFNLAFFPMHMLGLEGMPRRIASYSANPQWAFLNKISTLGAFIIGVSIFPFVYNLWKSRKGPIAGNDPWKANSLEWWTSSPPPVHNFDSLPQIRSERPVLDERLQREAEAALAKGASA
ncbi:MAG TPA: cytochrome c oxidase subunit I [Frankiaceae bacterium]|nr:cytochrome c oxidase subunit I [Frankiaceae bacterium]